jgi:NAD+ synthase
MTKSKVQKLVIKIPELEIDRIVDFLRTKYDQLDKDAVIAVSGGIDSALSLTLLTKALGTKRITPIFFPYGQQSVADSYLITEFNGFDREQVKLVNIEPLVKAAQSLCQTNEKTRLGNLMARSRMLLLYDLTKARDALVCGTENKSEKYLGYFTRFGDEASDIEPLIHLYKTQVRQLAKYLNLPEAIRLKNPSAGLWKGQTDEAELGFAYTKADEVLDYLEANELLEQIQELKTDKQKLKIIAKNLKLEIKLVEKVIQQVAAMEFKQQVPYHL